ncbi:MAG: hypothetical protein IJK31_09960 [Ruminococcus sp.]|nr:hypothetical protein [Ruminococcus sp.]HRR77745.1 hypothetical protein [Ruminococcus sp.]
MKRLIRIIILITVIRWGTEAVSDYRLEFPSGRRLLDCFGEMTEAITDLLHEVRFVPKDQNSDSCLYFSGSWTISSKHCSGS